VRADESHRCSASVLQATLHETEQSQLEDRKQLRALHRENATLRSHAAAAEAVSPNLAFTRYSFTSSRLCTSQSSFHSSGPPALPALLQYYCTSIAQYTTPPCLSLCMPYTIQYWQ